MNDILDDLKGKARNTVKDRLVSGENVMKMADIHPAIYWRTAAVFILSLVFFIFIAFELGMILLIVSLIMAVHAYLKKSILLLALTNKRILARYGILQVDVVDLHFDKIESIELERMPTGYMFGYSNVVLMGTGQRLIVIPYVSNGPQIRKAYNELVLGDK